MKNYMQKHKISLIFLAIALGVILLSSFFGNMVQNSGYSVKVYDLRDVTASDYLGTAKEDLLTSDFTQQKNAEGEWESFGGKKVTVTGFVESGLLFVPKSATPTNKAPAVVLTHGYLNNREMQLPFAVDLARRGFVVLAIDREAHGNNTVVSSSSYSADYGKGSYGASMYNAAAFLYYMDCVDQTRIGISGHSMGGSATNNGLLLDKVAREAGGTGIIAAGLVQANNASPSSYAEGVSVGILKADDDEFFFKSKLADGTPSISRQYLNSVAAAQFVGLTGYGNTADAIQVQNRAVYIDGKVTNVEFGQQAPKAFRAVYEENEIHPLNHFSTKSTADLITFFYTAFGTPAGRTAIAAGNQTWWIKEAFATMGLVGFFMLVLPLADLLLTIPCFAGLKRKDEEGVDRREILPALKGVRKHVSYWIAGIATTLFSGFSIEPIMAGKWANLSKLFFTQNTYFPQDTTGSVATWAIVCGLFALAATFVIWLINTIINQIKYKEEAHLYNEHPFAAAKIGGLANFAKTVLVGAIIVAVMYLIVFINWDIWKVDFRFWTFDVKVFNVYYMLPAMLRYACAFFIFYAINSILNQSYKVKNLPEWATIAINAVFSVFGILLVMLIQYGTFKSTGVLWQPNMSLSYIVLFPIIPVLVVATILSRRLYERTGNAWLGAVVNTLIFTIMTVANTSASYTFAGFFA